MGPRTLLLLAALLLLSVAPVAAGLAGAFAHPGAVVDVLAEARTWRLLGGTLALGALTVLGSLLIGVPVARLLARRRGGLVSVAALLLPVPLILPPWVAGVAWTRLLAPLGVELVGLPGATALLVLSLWPLVALFALRGFRRSGAAVAAASLARGPGAAWRAIELPLAAPSILAGALLVFVFAITDFSVVDFLSFNQPEPFAVLSMEVFQKWSRLQDPVAGAAVSVPALLPALVALALVLHLERRGQERGPSFAPALRLGALQATFLLLVTALGLAPLVLLVRWAAGNEEILGTLSDLGDGALLSVGTALGAGLLVAVVGYALARVALQAGGAVEVLLLGLALLPLAVPGVLLGVGEVRLWNHPANPLAEQVYRAPILLVLAAGARYLALGALVARALLLRQDPGPSQAARLSGAGPLRRWARVELPLALPALGLALLLGYLLTLRDLDLVTVVPAGSSTLSHRIYGFVHIASDEITATMCLALVALVLVPALAARLMGVPGVDCGGERAPP